MDPEELEERSEQLEIDAERAAQAGEIGDARELDARADELRERAEEARG